MLGHSRVPDRRYWTGRRAARRAGPASSVVLTLGVDVWDVLYVALTIVIFALFILLVKGVERLER